MKIVVVGATGTVGSAVVKALSARHEVVGVTRHSDPAVDLLDAASARALLERIAGVDAVVCCAGSARFKPLAALTDEDFAASLADKLMGQVNLARAALARLRDGGSITLTSGVLAIRPMPGSAAISLVNAGLEGFVRAAALEAPRRIRVNVVSPPWVKETLAAMGLDVASGLAAADVAKAYVDAVEGSQNGAVIDPMRFSGTR
ncbi:MAG TPA: short chain dehydrogenase [Myxococcales bacterium]|jgi:NAD(P)-dependent dehydrogenase (short-subunit alcohol dehydrogenase family)